MEQNKRFLRIGHRGACGHAPENTLASFAKAIELGVDMIELDVHLSRDDALVVIHDERLERTTNGFGEVGDLDLAALRNLDAGNGEKIPLLSEVIDLTAGRVAVNIELKGKGTARPTIELIERYTEGGLPVESFLVSSFDFDMLKEVRRASGRIRIGLNLESACEDFTSLAAALGASSVHPSLEIADRAMIEHAHRAELKVYVWTVNEPDDIARLNRMGVDGLFSNFPERL